jgi:glycosyltransferase involved in cell wall biosynthesis
MVPDDQKHVVLFAGGAQKRVFQMAEYFASIGHEVSLGSDDSRNSLFATELERRNVKFTPIGFRSGIVRNIFVFRSLYEIAAKEKIEIIHCNDRKTSMFAYIVSMILKIKLVYTARAIYYDKMFTRLFFGKNIIAISNGVKKNLIQYYKISEDRITVIYNGSNIKQASPEELNIIRNKYYHFTSRRIISFIGRLSEEKGLIYLLDAISKVKLIFPEVILLLVGDGELKSTLETKVQKLSIENNVIFCGNQMNVTCFYEISEFTVMPSISEGLGGSGIESIMIGRPLIGTTVGGIPEIVEDGVNGYLVPPRNSELLAQKIIDLLASPKIAKSMRENCIRIANEKFTLSQMMKNYENYYLNLINK